MNYYIGIDIGGTRIKMGVVSALGEIIVRENVETSSEGAAIINEISSFVIKYQKQYELKGVGISTPGIVKDDGYMQTSGAIKDFKGINLKEKLQQIISLPISIENDAKCAAIAEKWLGGAKEYANFVCITLGTAVGGAIFINHQLYRGFGGIAGEFGVTLCDMGKNYAEENFSMKAGCVAGLCRDYSYQVQKRVIDAEKIYASQANDEIARACIKRFNHHVGVLLVNIALSIAPEIIFIGGGISANKAAMDGIFEAYQQIINNYKVLGLLDMPKLAVAHLHNDAGLLGAVYPLIKAN